ncbi:hypothetical protein [Nocardia aurantiaca]|uniref:Uncharacterized protein n=1 Tax=Nocardia aurantiaca TaxID=2675850 RepID=A0A6I3KTV9_9NOCA|nr:hypothetical protein [Nocardia aurantiaca]MTE12476.1 hypothetical protein [Nocardia aurantiaca]
MRTMAEELSPAPTEGFERVGAVELRLTPMGAADIHGSIDEIACAAAAIGGEYFSVNDSMGSRITATVYRRTRRPSRWRCRRR